VQGKLANGEFVAMKRLNHHSTAAADPGIILGGAEQHISPTAARS